ncbi:MAG TPA: polyprenyl synthetase family protein [Candidatus Lustribacter sp.]|nr:polyprenyl synthetase family protein [Candidatus Lustribacter sp.]
MPTPLARADLLSRVQRVVDSELTRQGQVLAQIGPDMEPLVDLVASLLQGGKRLRAACAYWGYRAVGGSDGEPIVRLATAMEFFQAAALLHDDVMDDSDTRRGQPAAHRSMASRHTAGGWDGDSDRFGQGAAILAGNLCLTWTDALYATSGLPGEELRRARGTFDLMRTQLMGGQYLDLLGAARPWKTSSAAERIAQARRVIRFKSAKYTVEHPLLVGALAGGAGPADLAALSDYGLALGEAFQLRDDLLGVFGDPSATGKPAGDDLREGKRTVLIAEFLDAADAGPRALLGERLGRPDLSSTQIDELRDVIRGSGAVERVEARIEVGAQQARVALCRTERLDPEALAVLDELVEAATIREA